MSKFTCVIPSLMARTEEEREYLKSIEVTKHTSNVSTDPLGFTRAVNFLTFNQGNSPKDVISVIKERWLKLSPYSPKSILDNFTDFRIELYDTSQSPFNLFTDYKTSSNEYIVTALGKNGQREIVFGFPTNSSNVVEENALTKIKEHFGELIKDPNQFVPIQKSRLEKLIVGVNYPALNKKQVDGKPNTYSLQDLKNLVGNDYEYFFSSPYIVTDNNDHLTERVKENGISELVGKTVIFYRKFPTMGVTVDSHIASFGVSKAINGESELGILVLNNKKLNSFRDIFIKYKEYRKAGSLVESNFLLGLKQIKHLLNKANPGGPAHRILDKYNNQLYENRDAVYNSNYLFEELLNIEGQDMLDFALNEIDSIILSERNQDGALFKNGVEISLPIKNRLTLGKSIAVVSINSEEQADFVDESLEFTGLGEIPVLPPSVKLYFGEDNKAILETLENLTVPEVAPVKVNSQPVIFGLQPQVEQAQFSLVKPDLKIIENTVESIHLTLDDAKNFTTAYLSPIAMVNNKSESQNEINELLGLLKNCP